jgi:serine/threonine-protein kinase
MPRVPQAGDLLGRYRLLEELGHGGMAVVFRAEDPRLGREVAIKVMHAHLWGKAEYAARFSREARAVAALRHSNIVEVHDFGEGEDRDGPPGYLVSELVSGPTLREYIDKRGHPLPEVAVMIVLKLADALSCAHGRGIIHRDLKPENVMIAGGGRPVLTDFGIARIVEGEAVTQTGALVGSPAYMSPEQAKGLTVDERSDLFSLGVLLYQLCTGRLPFFGRDPIAVVLKVLEGQYDLPTRHNPQVGRSIELVIRELLQKDPKDRPTSAGQVMERLQAPLAEVGIEDVDAELARYFEEPGAYNQALAPRIITGSMEAARTAAQEQQIPRALSFCDRVLAFEPDNADALALVTQLTERGRSRVRLVLVLALAIVGLAGAGTMGYLGGGSIESSRATASDAGTGSVAAAVSTPRRDEVATGAAPTAQSTALSPDAGADVEPIPDTRPNPRRVPRRRLRPAQVRRASAAVAPARPDAAVPSERAPDSRAPDSRPRPTHGWIEVALGPYCDVFLDGEPKGPSPLQEPLRVTPGRHTLSCRNGPDGSSFRKIVTVEPGETRSFKGPVVPRIEVHMRLQRYDGVRILGRVYRSDFEIAPRRVRVDPVKGNRVVEGEGRYVPFPSHPCTLTDTPLVCR